MLTATKTTLGAIRSYYGDETRDLLRVLLNAASVAEANLALQLLVDSVPEKVLVGACNLREVLSELPSTPFTMRADEATLARTAGLERHIAAMSKVLGDGCELVVTTAGNLVLDVIVRHEGEKLFWNAVPVTDDFVNTGVLDLVVGSEYLLDAVIDLATCMGAVFNPKFYVSLEDWRIEYAADAFECLGDLF